jgi:Na+/phosphate symporter
VATDFFCHGSAEPLDTTPTAKRMAHIMMTHQTELAAAQMASFHGCFSVSWLLVGIIFTKSIARSHSQSKWQQKKSQQSRDRQWPRETDPSVDA